MRQIVTNVYKIDELTDGRDEAIEHVKDILCHSGLDWYSPIIEGFIEDMNKIGISYIKCYFSGFFSQGDGASFIGDINLFNLISSLRNKKDKSSSESLLVSKFKNADKNIFNTICAGIKRISSRYFHEYTVDAYFNGYGFNSDIEIGEILTSIIREYCKDLYSRLYKYYEEITSNEALIIFSNENEFEFYSDGRRYHEPEES